MEHEYHPLFTKITGYLEKKRRKNMISCYKKYWFVLEGKLLLYYKSKDEYDALSPCKGSINLGPTSNIKPCSSNAGVFQISRKSSTVTLRAETREEQQKWMQALIDALNQKTDYRKLSYFRHSIGELSPAPNNVLRKRHSTLSDNVFTYTADSSTDVIGKLQKNGGKSYGVGPSVQRSKTSLERQNYTSLSSDSIPSSSNYCKPDLGFRTSFMVDNEVYGEMDIIRRASSVESVDSSLEGIYERIPSSELVFTRGQVLDGEHKNNRTTFLTQNDIYWNKSDVQEVDGSADYFYGTRDLNDNNIRPQMSNQLSNPEDNIYAEAEEVRENRSGAISAEYAQIDQVEYDHLDHSKKLQYDQLNHLEKLEHGHLNQDKYDDDGEDYIEINNDKEKDKRIFPFGKKNKQEKEKSDKKKRSARKSESFLQRVWSKKSKKNKNKKEISRSSSCLVEVITMPDELAMKTLNELQQILTKKNTIAKQLDEKDFVKRTRGDEESRAVQREMSTESNDRTHHLQEMGCAPLCSKDQKQASASSYQDVPKHQQPPSVPPKMKKRMATELLDGILAHLKTETEAAKRNSIERQKNDETPKTEVESDENEGKVKALIKRFSIGKEEDVQLRQKNNNWKLKSSVAESNDLDVLLDELAKVTTAPILTPGVTTSLINPEISDSEILKLVPIRRRRMSDPDYDVPRPHRSLANLPKKDDNALEATRFFGPILKPSDYESHPTIRPPTPPADYSNLPSITPDSLEVECRKPHGSHDELRTVSFDSHDYLNYNKASHRNINLLVGDHLYADPRLLSKSRNDFSVFPDCDQSEESRFIDSLEP